MSFISFPNVCLLLQYGFLSGRVVQYSIGGVKLQKQVEYPYLALSSLLYANVPPTTLKSGNKGIIYQHLTNTHMISMPP